ncbi:TPA: hypothetical protein I9774_000562 [Serratia marcescens]|nr:hypothetical protein [Serratia marcescens]
MDNKLSELSKPVGFIEQSGMDYLRSGEDADIWPDGGRGGDIPLYSQEYVSALDGVAQYWIGESAGWKKRAKDAEKRIAELEGQLQSGFTPEALAQEERAENAKQRVAELEARLVVEIEPPPVIYPGRYDCHAMHSAIRRAGFRVAGDSEHVGDVDMRDERALTAVSDKQRIAELERILDGVTPVMIAGGWTAKGISDYAKSLESKLATPVRLPEPCVYEVNGTRFYDRLSEAEVIASLREQGFTVEGDE